MSHCPKCKSIMDDFEIGICNACKRERRKQKEFNIAVSWEECGIVKIKADSLEEALQIVEEDQSIRLPESSYVDGSFRADYEVSESLN